MTITASIIITVIFVVVILNIIIIIIIFMVVSFVVIVTIIVIVGFTRFIINNKLYLGTYGPRIRLIQTNNKITKTSIRNFPNRINEHAKYLPFWVIKII